MVGSKRIIEVLLTLDGKHFIFNEGEEK